MSDELKPYKSVKDIQLRLREAAMAIALSPVKTRHVETCDLAFNEINALRAENERLRGLLRDAYEYGGHQEGCSARFNDAPDNPKYRCRCGWDEDGPRIAAAIAELDQGEQLISKQVRATEDE